MDGEANDELSEDQDGRLALSAGGAGQLSRDECQGRLPGDRTRRASSGSSRQRHPPPDPGRLRPRMAPRRTTRTRSPPLGALIQRTPEEPRGTTASFGSRFLEVSPVSGLRWPGI